MNKLTYKFTVSKTYDIVTPESAKVGDYAESGFIYEKKQLTLRDLINELDEIHYFENFNENDLHSQSLYSSDPIVDYVDGSETREAIHINGNSRAMKRLNKILKEKYFKK